MLPKPNWGYWTNLVDVELREAIALSCNVTPESVEGELPLTNENWATSSATISRLNIARSHIESGTLVVRRSAVTNGIEREFIALTAFRLWAESLPQPFTFPDEFPKVAAPSHATVSADLPDELRAALEAFNAVRSNPASTQGKTPKKALGEWLEANKHELSKGARERIATIANWQPGGGAPKTPSSKPPTH